MFSKLFKTVKNGINKIIADPEEEEEQNTAPPESVSQTCILLQKTKHYSKYSLSDLFPFKIYIIDNGEKDIAEIAATNTDMISVVSAAFKGNTQENVSNLIKGMKI